MLGAHDLQTGTSPVLYQTDFAVDFLPLKSHFVVCCFFFFFNPFKFASHVMVLVSRLQNKYAYTVYPLVVAA